MPRPSTPRDVLSHYWGYDDFRPRQAEIIDSVLQGRDTLGLLPTGGGKSITFQVPAMLLPGLTVVVTPLISLMKDQVDNLRERGIRAAMVHSGLTRAEHRLAIDRCRLGKAKILYLSPEKLQSKSFIAELEQIDVSLLVVDEAHCISQWGYDFRPSYLRIAQLRKLFPDAPVLALTASATPQVADDIMEKLEFTRKNVFARSFARDNISYVVRYADHKPQMLLRVLLATQGSSIVYVRSRRRTREIAEELTRAGISADFYHAGLASEDKNEKQNRWKAGDIRVMVATNAFGMGIDKSNVGFVVHYNMPKDLESYYQEAGRAGRDGSPARCVLLYAPGDVQTAKFLITHSQEQEADPDRLRRDLARLDRMVRYCKTDRCLRADLLDYFGEIHGGRCGNCGSCTGRFVERDITVEAQKILSAVARVEKRYAFGLGAALIIKLLRGSRDKRVLQLGLDRLPTHGALKGVDRDRIQAYIDALIEEGFLVSDGGEFPVLRLTARAGDVLFRGERVLFRDRAPRVPEAGGASNAASRPAPREADGSLLAALKALRFRLAQEAGVPAYVVFSNASLADMAALRPLTMEEFLQVSGVGKVKAERYGQAFLQAVHDWRAGVDGDSLPPGADL